MAFSSLTRHALAFGFGCAVVSVACSQTDPPAGTGGTVSDGSGGQSTGGTGLGGDGQGTGGLTESGGGPGAGGTSATCTPTADCEPEPLPSSGDVHQDCVDRINQFRVGCWCEQPLARWSEGEACADEQAGYDAARNEAHAGFSDGICESGFGQNECPGWDSEQQVVVGCLQMMYDEGPPPTGSCSGQCFQDHGHFINMTDPDFGRVACGFFTTESGEVWATQNFAP